MKKTSKKRIEEIIISKHILIEGGNDTDRFMVVPYKELTTALLDAGLVFKDQIVVDEDKVHTVLFKFEGEYYKTHKRGLPILDINKALANTNIFKIEE